MKNKSLIGELKLSISSALKICLLMSVHSSGAVAVETLTLSDVHQQMYGGTITRPTPESAVGKYLAETKASSVIRKFPNAPQGSEIPLYALGEDKLVIAVSPETFEVFKKYFSSSNYLYQFYEPNDVRMVVGFEGNRGAEGQLGDQINYTVADTLITPILLDTHEAERAKTFFKLAEIDSRKASDPWRLKNADGVAYSAMSSFLGCTHWFGGIPLGNNLVDSYSFPKGEDDPKGESPNQKKLVNFITPGVSEEHASLLHQVWKVPGNQQLGEILNPAAFYRGEFANAGWVAYTLLGSVSAQRVPVVFILVDDEKAPLSQDFPLQISAE